LWIKEQKPLLATRARDLPTKAELVSCDKLQQVMEVSKSWGYPDRSLDEVYFMENPTIA
jgi:hypothetical protein